MMIKDLKGVERFSLSTRLYNTTKRIREKMHKEDSMVLGILWGGVGGGKSVKAQHIGYAIDSKLDINKVAFDKDEFIEAILNSRKEVVIDPHAKIFKPTPFFTEAGNPIGKTFKKVWYPVGEEAYRKKKESILRKYRGKELDKKPVRTTKIDFNLMDILIEKGYKRQDIADKCQCSIPTVDVRIKLLKTIKKRINT